MQRMRMHVIETDTGHAVVTTNAGATRLEPGGVFLRVRSGTGGEQQVWLSSAERVRLIGQLAAFAPPLGIPASRLQVGDQFTGESPYTLLQRLPDTLEDDGSPVVRWLVQYAVDGGTDVRGWRIDATTPLVRP